MRIRKNEYDLSRPYVHRRWTKAKPRQDPSCTKVHTTDDMRGPGIISANGSIPILLHPQLLKPLQASTAIDRTQREVQVDKQTADHI